MEYMSSITIYDYGMNPSLISRSNRSDLPCFPNIRHIRPHLLYTLCSSNVNSIIEYDFYYVLISEITVRPLTRAFGNLEIVRISNITSVRVAKATANSL